MPKPKEAVIQEVIDEAARQALHRARREGWNRAQLRQLQALRAQLEELGFNECKTIGNGHPPGLHCFACTWQHLYEETDKAVKFWSNEELMKGALS